MVSSSVNFPRAGVVFVSSERRQTDVTLAAGGCDAMTQLLWLGLMRVTIVGAAHGTSDIAQRNEPLCYEERKFLLLQQNLGKRIETTRTSSRELLRKHGAGDVEAVAVRTWNMNTQKAVEENGEGDDTLAFDDKPKNKNKTL